MRATAVSLAVTVLLAAAPALADGESSSGPTDPSVPVASPVDASRTPERVDETASPISPRDVTVTYCILNRIGRLDGVDAGDVHVRVVRGAVTLYGTIASERGRTRVLLAANDCEGVQVLRDEMSTVPASFARGGGPNDPEIAAAAVRLSHERGVVGGPLSFSVQHGVVTVRGEVERYTDALRVIRKLYELPGVRAVRSSLDVNQGHVVLVAGDHGTER